MAEQKETKFTLIEEAKQNLERLSEARGVLRCALIFSQNQLLDALRQALDDEDRQRDAQMDELRKAMQDQLREG